MKALALLLAVARSREQAECCERGGQGPPGHCAPLKVHVRQDRESAAAGTLSLVDATRIYETALPPMAQISHEPFYCLDDRVEVAGLATPGGDLGEFILALDAYTDLTPGRQVTQHMIDVWLETYLKGLPESRVFVHCTDDGALAHLQAELQDETLSLTNPPVRAQPALLAALEEVENVGDAHLRLLLKYPESYHVDSRLVKMAIHSFYRILWSGQELGKRLKLVQLAGSPRPTAFLEVSTTQPCEASGTAPLLTPRDQRFSVLVSSMDAVEARRGELADFFVHLGSMLPMHLDRETFHKRLDRHGLQALEMTGARIAKDLPFYSLTYA